jgi:hypothetical protein
VVARLSMKRAPSRFFGFHRQFSFRWIRSRRHIPKVCECLHKNKKVLFTFYGFPAQHWSRLRTTNPMESTFATVRLRTERTEGSGSRIATLPMAFKLGLEAQKHWRRLNGPELVAKVVTGVKCRRRRVNRKPPNLLIIRPGCSDCLYTTIDNISPLCCVLHYVQEQERTISKWNVAGAK